jgi:hypothetical protein
VISSLHTFTLVALNCVLGMQPATCGKTEKIPISQSAQDYIAAFRRGEDFTPPAKGVFVNGQPDPAAVKILGDELATAGPSVREKLVALLVDMSVQTDPLTPKGAEVLRHPQIVALLAGAGLAKPDAGREAAMDALRKLTTQATLSKFDVAIVKALEESPSDEAFLLVAKAKPKNAKALVDRLAATPQWRSQESVRIASAALGTTQIEDAYLKIADEATDGKALAKALGPLALMGTPRSLRAIAERLRTHLTILVPGAYEKSLRLNVLDALLYNFPDQTVLYPNNIIKESDYTAAEQFCTKTLGVIYTTPPPPFMTYRGFPIPRPK